MRSNSERVSAMLLGRRAVRVVPLPGFDEDEGAEPVLVGVRILLEQDIDEARLDATQYVRNRAGARKMTADDLLSVDAELLDREVQRAIVHRAFIDPDDVETAKEGKSEPRKFFATLHDVRALDSVMFRVFFEIYADHQNYVNPLRSLGEEETRELADALSKDPTVTARLGLYDAPTLRLCLVSMAFLRATPQTLKSNTSGSLLSDGPS